MLSVCSFCQFRTHLMTVYAFHIIVLLAAIRARIYTHTQLIVVLLCNNHFRFANISACCFFNGRFPIPKLIFDNWSWRKKHTHSSSYTHLEADEKHSHFARKIRRSNGSILVFNSLLSIFCYLYNIYTHKSILLGILGFEQNQTLPSTWNKFSYGKKSKIYQMFWKKTCIRETEAIVNKSIKIGTRKHNANLVESNG